MTDYRENTEQQADSLQTAADQAEERAQQDGERAEERPERQTIDLSEYPVNKKGNAIVPDDYFLDHYKELPNGTMSQDGQRMAWNGGYMQLLSEEDRKKGGIARQAKKAKEESFAAAIKRALYSKAPAKTCKELGLDLDSSMLEAIVSAQTLLATDTAKNSTKAAEFLRDTIGEKPADRQEISADIITAEERALLEKVNARLTGSEQAATGPK